MKTMLHTLLAVSISFALNAHVNAQDSNKDKWQVDNPGGVVEASISV